MSGTGHAGVARSRLGGMSRGTFLRLGGLAGAAVLGGGSLAGCGGSSSGGLTVASWDVASDALKATIPLFKKERPGTEVRMQAITIDYQQLIPRLQAGSGAPDVFSLAQQDFQNFLTRFPGEFVDVTDRMEKYTSQFADAPLSHARKDGKLFAARGMAHRGVGYGATYRAFEIRVGVRQNDVRDVATRALLERLDRAGIEITAKLAVTDFGIANVYA